LGAHIDAIKGKGLQHILEPGLTLCVEALVGEVGGDHMVKLEDQGVITDDGFETMSVYPWDQRLFPR
jgi:Xaa-Pro aminopeptidase